MIKLLARIMLALILFALILVALTGCGTVRKVSNSIDSSAVVKQVEEVKQKTVITEKVDTVVAIKGEQVKASSMVDEFLRGDTVENEHNGISVKAWYDPETRSVHAEAKAEDKEVPVNIDRTTVVDTESKTETKSKTEVEAKHAEVDKDSTVFSWWIIAALILLAALVYLIDKIRPKFPI